MVISPSEIADKIEDFVRREFRVAPGDRTFGRDVQLYDSGFVDSVGAVELISFVESTFKVKLDDEDIFSEAFTTINGISLIVARLLGESVRDARRPTAVGIDAGWRARRSM